MTARKADRWIVLGLIAALVIESFLLLKHLGWMGSEQTTATRGQEAAGVVAKNENQLKRRSVDSLVWEKSHSDETVYFYDSLLTLAQSTATIKLARDTQVELAENTLVTIEPPEQSARGEIRLKFVRGDLKARNPWIDTKVDGPDFVVDLKAGSEMQMRRIGEHEFEVQVRKGEAQVSGKDGTHAVLPTQLLRLAEGKSQALDVDQALKWTPPPAARIYSHENSNEVLLSWSGGPTELRLQKAGGSEERIPLAPDQKSLRLTLESGRYTFYLRADGRTSDPLTMQLWKAPLLHLISPLPRNRVRSQSSIPFLWTRIPEVASYVFKWSGARGNGEETLDMNSYRVEFPAEDDVEWSVWGKDRDGFLIPPLYKYKLFIRNDPFEAPSLNAPRVRKPAQTLDKTNGAFHWLQNILWSAAYAAEETRYEAYFSWQPVQGADEYWLEISESADFRTPLVSVRLSKTEFLWRDFRECSYFWRVAAGGRDGRMGVFSEPARVSLEEGVEVRKIEVVEKRPVMPAPKQPLKSDSDETAKSNSEVMPKVSSQQSYWHVDTPRQPHSWRAFWNGGYGVWQVKGEKNVDAELSGSKVLSLAVEKDFFKKGEMWWNGQMTVAQTSFKAPSSSEYPFQQDIKTQEVKFRFTRWQPENPWGIGFSAMLLPKIERNDLESIKASSTLVGGIHMRRIYDLGSAEYNGDVGLNFGFNDYGLSTTHRLLYRQRRALLGVGLELIYLRRGYYHSLGMDAFLTAGFEF